MAIERRPETCPDCGALRERQWIVRDVAAGAPVPRGFRVERRRGGHKRIAGRTPWTTLCDCDAAL